ncbi:MAG TPA: adenosine kinase [Alphaproteobacteria bacterium]|nr:adenosine kinase [Alphaproteobacteria bacterium]
MSPAPEPVVGIGNAIVDVIAHADDTFLAAEAMAKGMMTLIDADRAETLYGRMGPAVEISGGSAANTMAGIASLGGRPAFIGKVRDDQLGEIFAHDIRAAGVTFRTLPAKEGPATARCLIFVTPDAQRTMNTFLGASVELGPEDVEEEQIASAGIVYLEGYLWDRPRAKEAFRKAARIAREAGGKVALTLSDPFCVERHRAEFQELVKGPVDILFANEAEIRALWQVADFDKALGTTRGLVEMAALTRSEKGSVVLAGGRTDKVEAEPVGRLVDTTGAGDLFAAGFLHGLTKGCPPIVAARMGAIAAAEVISHVGARPERPLAALVEERLG